MALEVKQFQIGFNCGYILAKYDPEILAVIMKDVHPKNSFIHGIYSGLKEYKKERFKDRLNDVKQLKAKDNREDDREINF